MTDFAGLVDGEPSKLTDAPISAYNPFMQLQMPDEGASNECRSRSGVDRHVELLSNFCDWLLKTNLRKK